MKNPKLKLLIFTTSFPDHKNSYRGKFVQNYTRELAKHNIESLVLTAKIYRVSQSIEKENGITVYRFPFLSENRLLIEYQRIPVFRMLSYMLSCLLFGAALIMRERVHLLHAHFVLPTGLIAVLLGRFFKKPVIVTAHGSDILRLPQRSSWLKQLTIWTLKHADKVTSVAFHLTAQIMEWGIPESSISTLPMGIDVRSFNLEPCPTDYPVILSNRNLLRVYDVSTLIRSLPAVLEAFPNTRILIAGKGAQRMELEKLARELEVQNHVEFLGYVPNEKMPDLLQRATIYVSTSVSDGTSVSLLEALSCGAFPVVTDIPANRSWITDGKNGYLFHKNEPEDLTRKIVAALKDTGLRENAARNNRHLVIDKASWSVIIHEYLDSMLKLINS